jgi:hypothetical protein
LKIYAVLASKNGQTWMVERAYSGAAVFFSAADAEAHVHAICATGIVYQVIELTGSEVLKVQG